MEETLKNPESELKGNASGSRKFRRRFKFSDLPADCSCGPKSFDCALIGCVLLITLLDIIFDRFLFEPYVSLIETLSGSKPGEFAEVDIGFAPEVWQAILAMVLGTLILVISIASQSIPN